MSEEEFLENLNKFEPIIKFKAKRYEIEGLEWEDIAQEIRIKLWRKYPQFNNTLSQFGTWARKVADNCIIDLQRTANLAKNKPLNEREDIDKLVRKEAD